MRLTSNRDLARQLGLSDTAVRRAENAGRIEREADGSWDLAKVRAAWSGNTDQAQQRRGPGAGQRGGRPTRARMKPVPEAAVGAVRETLRDQGEEPAPGSPSFLQARTANEVLKAQERKLRLQRQKGELIDRGRATAQVFTLARQERDAWAQWPARVAANLAAELSAACSEATGQEVRLEAHTVQTALEKAVQEHLEQLADIRPRLD